MGEMAKHIETKLNTAFDPTDLMVEDQSEQHRGHAGYREGGESHFHVRMRSAKFAGKSRVDCQRMVYRILAEELAEQVHALSLDLKP
ncbi:MAG: BolA family protein [Pseudomonadota bacterium]